LYLSSYFWSFFFEQAKMKLKNTAIPKAQGVPKRLQKEPRVYNKTNQPQPLANTQTNKEGMTTTDGCRKQR